MRPAVPSSSGYSFEGTIVASDVHPGVRYRLERALGQGGTAIAYFATRMASDGEGPAVVKIDLAAHRRGVRRYRAHHREEGSRRARPPERAGAPDSLRGAADGHRRHRVRVLRAAPALALDRAGVRARWRRRDDPRTARGLRGEGHEIRLRPGARRARDRLALPRSGRDPRRGCGPPGHDAGQRAVLRLRRQRAVQDQRLRHRPTGRPRGNLRRRDGGNPRLCGAGAARRRRSGQPAERPVQLGGDHRISS